MVSFQCDACADVVKKPKLDQHRVRCGAPFTCIDCSQTFQTPVDWKGHTSCISEAQKYQGALYKPKQNGSSRENQSYGGARGNLQGRGGPWNRPPPRSQATGANGTPLGTPPRMSPVTAPPSVQDGKSTATAIPPAVSIEANEKPSKHKKQRSEGVSTVEVEVRPSRGDVKGYHTEIPSNFPIRL
ncbi:hypothetical protein K439DRAFT_1007667 [Ramaria rubella]|nr:hypothetical protein K439DRAFT_1007667 [Ramaria rubella]